MSFEEFFAHEQRMISSGESSKGLVKELFNKYHTNPSALSTGYNDMMTLGPRGASALSPSNGQGQMQKTTIRAM